MFRKYTNPDNSNASADDLHSDDHLFSENSDSLAGFDLLDEKELSELSDQLSEISDSSWDDMLNSYDKPASADETQTPSEDSGDGFFDDDAFDSDLPEEEQTGSSDGQSSDGFDDGLEDDLDGDPDDVLEDDLDGDSDDVLEDDLDGDSDDVLEDDLDMEPDDAMDDDLDMEPGDLPAKQPESETDAGNLPDRSPSGKEEPVRQTSAGSLSSARLIVTLLAIVFGLGVLLFVKVTNAHQNDYTPRVVSDSSMTESSAPAVSSEAPEPVSSQEEEKKPVYKVLKNGSAGDEVQKLQNRLYKLGYISKDSCTGYYGDFTEKIVKRFQKKTGLPETGIADQATQEKLYSDDAPKGR